MGSKPPAAVGERISKGEKHDLVAAAPLSTNPLEQGSAGGPVQSSPKLVEHIESGSTRFAEQLSLCIVFTALAAPSVRSRVFASGGPSASMARRGCRASCFRLAHADPSISSNLPSRPTSSPVDLAGSSYCTSTCLIDRIAL